MDTVSLRSVNSSSDLLDSIDRIYFNEFNNENETTTTDYKDIIEYELKNANNKLDLKLKIEKLKKHREHVNKRVSDLILQNSKAYSKELQRVSEFKLLLEDSYQMCSIARRSLLTNETMFLLPQLKLVRKQMKKQHLISLFKSILAIRQLHETNMHINELINKKEFSEAAKTCFECDKSLVKYEQFKCINALKKRIKLQLEQIEQALDSNLINVCTDYDESLYERIVVSYKLLNKLDSFTDKLNTQILSAVNTTAFNTLVGLLMQQKQGPFSMDNLKRKEYNELCALLTTDIYKVCLIELCNNLWTVMKNYYHMFVWHNNYCLNDDVEQDDGSNLLLRNEFKKKFTHGLNRVWQDVQMKLSICFKSMCFDHFKFDDFIEILTLSNRFIEIGQDYCSSRNSGSNNNTSYDSQIMIKATKDQTLAFFKSYHVAHLEELKMFMENETWQLWPVKNNFSIFKLHEYKFLKENKFDDNHHMTNICVSNLILSTDYLNNQETKSRSSQETSGSTSSHETQSASSFDFNHNINEMLSIKSPFDIVYNNNNSNNNNPNNTNNKKEKNKKPKNSSSNESSDYSDSDNDEPATDNEENEEEIATTEPSDQEEDDDDEDNSSLEQQPHNKTNKRNNMFSVALLIAKTRRNGDFKTPMLTNTTLNIMRLLGKYIQMLSIFRIISNDVIAYLMQLFYFYFYYIFMNFAQGEIKNTNDSSAATASLEVIIKNIKNELFIQSKYNIAEPVIASIKVMKNRQDYLNSIHERIVAAESLLFLAEQLENIFPLINECLPITLPNKNIDVYLNVLKETNKMRFPIYMHISKVAIDYQQICESISRVNWDLHDIMSQHNTYVDVLLRQMQQMITDIESLKDRMVVEKKTLGIFQEQAIRLMMKMLVEGYSSIKKCSNEGRALMQLDFQQLIVKLEKICDLRPIPDKDYVEVYIKAYYLPDSSIEKWVKDHSEYSPKHIVSLINTMAQVTRKTRTVITSSFDNI